MNEQLTQLLCQKGEIITNLEILQEQLKIVNQQIFQLKNKEQQPEKPETEIAETKKGKKAK